MSRMMNKLSKLTSRWLLVGLMILVGAGKVQADVCSQHFDDARWSATQCKGANEHDKVEMLLNVNGGQTVCYLCKATSCRYSHSQTSGCATVAGRDVQSFVRLDNGYTCKTDIGDVPYMSCNNQCNDNEDYKTDKSDVYMTNSNCRQIGYYYQDLTFTYPTGASRQYQEYHQRAYCCKKDDYDFCSAAKNSPYWVSERFYCPTGTVADGVPELVTYDIGYGNQTKYCVHCSTVDFTSCDGWVQKNSNYLSNEVKMRYSAYSSLTDEQYCRDRVGGNQLTPQYTTATNSLGTEYTCFNGCGATCNSGYTYKSSATTNSDCGAGVLSDYYQVSSPSGYCYQCISGTEYCKSRYPDSQYGTKSTGSPTAICSSGDATVHEWFGDNNEKFCYKCNPVDKNAVCNGKYPGSAWSSSATPSCQTNYKAVVQHTGKLNGGYCYKCEFDGDQYCASQYSGGKYLTRQPTNSDCGSEQVVSNSTEVEGGYCYTCGAAPECPPILGIPGVSSQRTSCEPTEEPLYGSVIIKGYEQRCLVGCVKHDCYDEDALTRLCKAQPSGDKTIPYYSTYIERVVDKCGNSISCPSKYVSCKKAKCLRGETETGKDDDGCPICEVNIEECAEGEVPTYWPTGLLKYCTACENVTCPEGTKAVTDNYGCTTSCEHLITSCKASYGSNKMEPVYYDHLDLEGNQIIKSCEQPEKCETKRKYIPSCDDNQTPKYNSSGCITRCIDLPNAVCSEGQALVSTDPNGIRTDISTASACVSCPLYTRVNSAGTGCECETGSYLHGAACSANQESKLVITGYEATYISLINTQIIGRTDYGAMIVSSMHKKCSICQCKITECPEGEHPVEVDDDGCISECTATCERTSCGAGEVQSGYDEYGCIVCVANSDADNCVSNVYTHAPDTYVTYPDYLGVSGQVRGTIGYKVSHSTDSVARTIPGITDPGPWGDVYKTACQENTTKTALSSSYRCNPYDCNPYNCNGYDCNPYSCNCKKSDGTSCTEGEEGCSCETCHQTCYETCYHTCYNTCYWPENDIGYFTCACQYDHCNPRSKNDTPGCRDDAVSQWGNYSQVCGDNACIGRAEGETYSRSVACQAPTCSPGTGSLQSRSRYDQICGKTQSPRNAAYSADYGGTVLCHSGEPQRDRSSNSCTYGNNWCFVEQSCSEISSTYPTEYAGARSGQFFIPDTGNKYAGGENYLRCGRYVGSSDPSWTPVGNANTDGYNASRTLAVNETTCPALASTSTPQISREAQRALAGSDFTSYDDFTSLLNYDNLPSCQNADMVNNMDDSVVCVIRSASLRRTSSLPNLLAPAKSVVVFVDGDLTVDSDVITSSGYFKAFIVRGTITISSSVGREVYNADTPATKTNGSAYYCPQPADAQLQGMFVANAFRFESQIIGAGGPSYLGSPEQRRELALFDRNVACDRQLILAGSMVVWGGASNFDMQRSFEGCGINFTTGTFTDLNRIASPFYSFTRADLVLNAPAWLGGVVTNRQEVN